jgi:hypothetical protein
MVDERWRRTPAGRRGLRRRDHPGRGHLRRKRVLEWWLRDGRLSVLVDAREIVAVTSASNYVEYELTDRRKHLIRSTPQAELARLAPFGIARLRRSRLVNLKRMVALEWGPSGDFKVRLDTGEAVLASRRANRPWPGLPTNRKTEAANRVAPQRPSPRRADLRISLSCFSGYFGFVLSGCGGRATPQGSNFSFGSGMRSSAAL